MTISIPIGYGLESSNKLMAQFNTLKPYIGMPRTNRLTLERLRACSNPGNLWID